MLKYKLVWSNYYKKFVFRLWHVKYKEWVKVSYIYSTAFTFSQAVNNVNAMRKQNKSFI